MIWKHYIQSVSICCVVKSWKSLLCPVNRQASFSGLCRQLVKQGLYREMEHLHQITIGRFWKNKITPVTAKYIYKLHSLNNHVPIFMKRIDFSVHVKCISMQNGIGFRLYDGIYKNLLKWCILCVYVWKHHGNNLTLNFRIHDLNPWPDPFQHRADFMIWTKLIHWIFTINYILIVFWK